MNFTTYLQNFTAWLKITGYSNATVISMPRQLQEFFNYLATHNIHHIEAITATHSEAFIHYQQNRPNKRREGGISASHINKYMGALHLFNRYLKSTSNIYFPLQVKRLQQEPIQNHTILTTSEIKSLYHATDESPTGMRDRAMLAVYYGCGLRKTEGIHLDVSDVLTERKLLFVRHAKNNYQRYTPITTANLKYLEHYIYHARPLLLGDKSNEQGLFISERGNRICKERFYQQLKLLCKKAGITKETGIHTLRHSIATHLLQSGMELEHIALFLGHRCLDSTQRYTHILQKL